MTDEELKEKLKIDGFREGFDEGYKKATKRAYERQKDLTEIFIRDGEKIKKLGEDIAELKDQKENIELAINEGEEIIAELKEQNKDLCESLDIMNNRESELLDQIKKMKCCENCKHHYWNYGDLDCRLNYSCYDTNYDKWECKE